MATTTLPSPPRAAGSVVSVSRIRRVQTGARATLVLGIGASLAANVLAADPSLAGRVIAAWSPIALLLTVELLSRVPATPGWLSRLRVTAAATIAGIAAWVSYWHMVEVAETYGEATVAAHLLPLSVDGLVIVASVCLVELAERLNPPTPTERPAVTAGPQASEPPVTETQPTGETPRSAATPAKAKPKRSTAAPSSGGGSSMGVEVRRLAVEHPDWTQAQLAEEAGCSVRTVRRHLTTPTASTASTTAEADSAAGPAAPTDQSDPTSPTQPEPQEGGARPREEVAA